MISRRGVTRQLELDKPIIAAINGDAIGLAATHALAERLTVMAEDARIGDNPCLACRASSRATAER